MLCIFQGVVFDLPDEFNDTVKVTRQCTTMQVVTQSFSIQELWRDSKRTFLITPQQLPELKERTDSYGAGGYYGNHHNGWNRQHQGRTNGYNHYNSHSRHQ